MTKKERILDLISKNPYLSLDEIGEQTDSSSNYVRTILAGEGLTLTKLRKFYGKKAAEQGFRIDLEEFRKGDN
ncbi:hypothetical protein U472_00280 [Orenia metallireducens]|uniref:Uncharacterized protein n=1 Tax=Orenia metallireducens TaxID=1413210 RepID=A0A1C0ADD4_9FIRM|nr:hypothetical protein [Orenia metallireducens]OCL28628.1 hypothetical protein U472_00280 [Orenia metallireducens]